MSGMLQTAIRDAIETGDLSLLEDHFDDDVELGVAMDVASPVSGERRKGAVTRRLRSLRDARLPAGDTEAEFFANGDRIVAFWDEEVTLRSGVALRSSCTLVFDIRDGRIARLAMHHDLALAQRSTHGSAHRVDASRPLVHPA